MSRGVSHFNHRKVVDLSQDIRFKNKHKQMMKDLVIHKNIKKVRKKSVDMKKVKTEWLKGWTMKRLILILGFEDEIILDYIINQLELKQFPDPKEVQISITGFLQAKNAKDFIGELWPLLISATENGTGIPQSIIDNKKLEIQKRQMKKEANETQSTLGKSSSNSKSITILDSDNEEPVDESKNESVPKYTLQPAPEDPKLNPQIERVNVINEACTVGQIQRLQNYKKAQEKNIYYAEKDRIRALQREKERKNRQKEKEKLNNGETEKKEANVENEDANLKNKNVIGSDDEIVVKKDDDAIEILSDASDPLESCVIKNGEKNKEICVHPTERPSFFEQSSSKKKDKDLHDGVASIKDKAKDDYATFLASVSKPGAKVPIESSKHKKKDRHDDYRHRRRSRSREKYSKYDRKDHSKSSDRSRRRDSPKRKRRRSRDKYSKSRRHSTSSSSSD